MLKGLHKWYDKVEEPWRMILCIGFLGMCILGISTFPFWLCIPCAAVLAIVLFSRIAYLKGK